MSDIACIYEMNMLKENERMERDLLTGRGMDILLCVMNEKKLVSEISSELMIPTCTVQLYLNRLVKAGLVKEKKMTLPNDTIRSEYSLIKENLEIVNKIIGKNALSGERNRKVEIAAQHFAGLTKKAIRSANNNVDMPNIIKTSFMKARKTDMENFLADINNLYEKYLSKEDLSAEETYSLMTILAPFEVEEAR
jgi:predicted transcriptional regulator